MNSIEWNEWRKNVALYLQSKTATYLKNISIAKQQRKKAGNPPPHDWLIAELTVLLRAHVQKYSDTFFLFLSSSFCAWCINIYIYWCLLIIINVFTKDMLLHTYEQIMSELASSTNCVILCIPFGVFCEFGLYWWFSCTSPHSIPLHRFCNCCSSLFFVVGLSMLQ